MRGTGVDSLFQIHLRSTRLLRTVEFTKINAARFVQGVFQERPTIVTPSSMSTVMNFDFASLIIIRIDRNDENGKQCADQHLPSVLHFATA